MWKLFVPADYASLRSSRWRKWMAIKNLRRQIWSTLSVHPTTARRMLRQAAWGRRVVYVTEPRHTQMAATSCVAAEDTTLTSTPRCGSVTASFSGAALSNATPVVRGRRCSPANEQVCIKDRWAGIRMHRNSLSIRLGNKERYYFLII